MYKKFVNQLQMNTRFENLSIKNRIRFLWILYTITFACISLWVLYPFIVKHKSLVWYGDGLTIQYPAFVYFGKYLRNIVSGLLGGTGIPMFDLQIGMGADIIQFLCMWYLEPITVLSALVPLEYAELLYSILVIVRMYLLGVAFLFLCRYFQQFNYYAIVGALIYTFTGYTFYFVKHPMLYGGLLFLPLLIVGVDKVLKSRKISLLCAFTIFLSLFSGYQLLYINSLICILYFLIRYFVLYGIKEVKIFFLCVEKAILTWLLGIGMGMVLFLPTFLSFLNSNRTDPIISTESLFSYGEKWFRNLFVHMFSPAEDTKFWLYNGYIIFALLAVVVLFTLRKEFKTLKWSFAILCLLFSIPLFTFVFYGFNSINHRWSYVTGLVFAIICVCVFPRMQKLETKTINCLFFICGLYTICVIVKDYDVNTQNTYTMLACIFLWLSFAMILYFNIYKTNIYGYRLCLLLMVMIQCSTYGYYTYAEKYGNYASEFMDYGTTNDFLLNTTANVEIDDDSFYRIEAADGQKLLVNSALLGEYNGVSVCTNQQTKYIQEFNDIIENRANTIAEMYDLDNRTFLETLCGVKYFTATDEQHFYIPYGFEEEFTDNGTKVYQNQNSLPLGYTYSSVLNQEDFRAMNPIERQEAMLQGVILSDDPVLNTNFPEAQVQIESGKVPYTIVETHGLEIDGNQYHVYEDWATITYEFPAVENAETYFRAVGFNADNLGWADIDYTVSTNIADEYFSKTFKVRTASNQYTIPGKYNHLVNLGYHEKAINTITLTFPSAGEYVIEDIEIYQQKMTHYESYVNQLAEESLKNINFSTNRIEGTITTTGNKLLYLSVPYSSGWTAYVNGEETEIYRANAMFMSIPLQAGKHTVELVYETPGVRVGMYISLFSGSIFILLLIWKKRNKNAVSQTA